MTLKEYEKDNLEKAATKKGMTVKEYQVSIKSVRANNKGLTLKEYNKIILDNTIKNKGYNSLAEYIQNLTKRNKDEKTKKLENK